MENIFLDFQTDDMNQLRTKKLSFIRRQCYFQNMYRKVRKRIR